MRPLISCAFLACLLAAQSTELAPQGTLRVVYLAGNPAQAVRDNATGQVIGLAADLSRELGRRMGVPVIITPSTSPQTIIDAVSKGEADIGFVAYEATRRGTVEFSETYMLVQQSFLVRGDSPMRAVADVDRSGQKIGGTRNDSMRSEERRVGKECTEQCRSRWSPYH